MREGCRNVGPALGAPATAERSLQVQQGQRLRRGSAILPEFESRSRNGPEYARAAVRATCRGETANGRLGGQAMTRIRRGMFRSEARERYDGARKPSR